MSLNNCMLPNEVIRLILLYCQTSKDYSSQSLVNRQWFYEAFRLRSLMKTRFAYKTSPRSRRFIMWDMDLRITVIGYGEHCQRHGLEECVQAYHRVGGPSAEVYYLERHWKEGKLHGLEILREINTVWYTNHQMNPVESSNEMIIHPYEGLDAVDSMHKYRRHSQDSKLPDGCDYLGKIIFKHDWISGTIEESKKLEREFSDELDESNASCLYDFIHTTSLHEIVTESLPI